MPTIARPGLSSESRPIRCVDLRELIDRRLIRSRYVFVVVAFFLGHEVVSAESNSPHINYMLHCQGCHLPGGIGHPGLVPNLRGQIGRFLASDAGRAYLVQVPGSAQADLDDGELAEVLNWMLLDFDPEHVDSQFTRYTADEVTAYRSVRLKDVSATRRALLEQEP